MDEPCQETVTHAALRHNVHSTGEGFNVGDSQALPGNGRVVREAFHWTALPLDSTREVTQWEWWETPAVHHISSTHPTPKAEETR